MGFKFNYFQRYEQTKNHKRRTLPGMPTMPDINLLNTLIVLGMRDKAIRKPLTSLYLHKNPMRQVRLFSGASKSMWNMVKVVALKCKIPTLTNLPDPH